MLRCAQLGIDAVEALERQNREFLESLAGIVGRDFPNPYDDRYDLEMLLDEEERKR